MQQVGKYHEKFQIKLLATAGSKQVFLIYVFYYNYILFIAPNVVFFFVF